MDCWPVPGDQTALVSGHALDLVTSLIYAPLARIRPVDALSAAGSPGMPLLTLASAADRLTMGANLVLRPVVARTPAWWSDQASRARAGASRVTGAPAE